MKPGLLARLREEGDHGTAAEMPIPAGGMAAGMAYWRAGRRIGLAVHLPERPSPPHTRDYVELYYQCAGTGTCRVNDRNVTVAEGELLLLGQNTLLELPEQDAQTLAARFFIKPDFFGEILKFLGSDQSPLREFLLRCLGQENPYGYLQFHVGGVVQMENLMENLMLQLLDHPDSRRAIPMHTVGLLFLHLLDRSDLMTAGIREQMAVLRALQYIELSYAQASLTQVAEGLHCDVSWLSREIRRRTGRTFTELLQERRLNQAAWMLKNTREKVSDIAVSVGYENISYFHRIFARRFGCSPKKYRDQT